MKKIKGAGHLKIWSLSADSNEYERYERLLEASNKYHLSTEMMNSALQLKGKENLQREKSITIIHDPSDIRKPYSLEMENIDKVQSLNGEWINGYSSFNSVAIDSASKIHLLGCTPYSKKENKDYQELQNEQIISTSKALKEVNKDCILIHCLDRGFDDQECFKLIDKDLEDKFVVRIKLNRNSSIEQWDEAKGKQTKLKLKNAPFSNSFTRTIQKFSWGKKVYFDLTATYFYDRFFVGDDNYWVVKVELKDKKGQLVFKEPMLLVSNILVFSEEVALFVFTTYLKRSKIEGVFKFLKTHLGWETFQVRDFMAIQHLIVLCFFIGGYFYEIEDELINNEWMCQICKLGGGKGKISKSFFLNGLKKMAHYWEIKLFMQENNLTEKQLKELFNQLE